MTWIRFTRLFSTALLWVTLFAPGRAFTDPVPPYVSSRAPLASTPYVQLPLGSVKANGWLLMQLRLQTSGLTGYSELIYTNGAYTDLTTNNGWLGGAGDSWERAPYYVRGLVSLAYTLDDAGLKTKAQKWIDWTLTHQQTNGNIGPLSLPADDWWPRMPMLNALADYYDATGDSRATNVLMRYFQFQSVNNPGAMWTDWAQYRVIDNIEVVLWLYDRSGDAFLLTLADKLKALSVDWSTLFNNNAVTNMHGVNVAEGYKYPAVWYRRSLSTNDRVARANGHRNLMRAHGQPHDLPAATEWLSGKSSLQGYELCCAVDRLYSDGISQIIFGDADIGDNIEKIAFNALPGSLSKTTRHYEYYSLPNQPQLTFWDSSTMDPRFNTEYGHGLMPGAVSGWLCCNYNFGMGWPKFTAYSWAATESNGLAVMTYAPTEVSARVANGVNVTITEDTQYPFEEQIRFTITSTQSVAFPLKLRMPGWCTNPTVRVNGTPQSGITTGTFFTVNRTWASNDTVTVDLPMTLKAVTQTNNSISLERGPLIYSLMIGENWVISNPIIVDGLDFSQNRVYPTTPWNYALGVVASNVAAYVTVHTNPMPANPFEQATTPITLTMKARLLPTWGMAGNGLPTEVPVSPVASSQGEEIVTLVPFGAENLRVTYFPHYAATTNLLVAASNWTAYNDSAWAGDDVVGSFTGVFTTNNPGGLASGTLMEEGGQPLGGVTVSMSTNAASFLFFAPFTASTNIAWPAGTDAALEFEGKIGRGYACEIQGTNAVVTVSIAGLQTTKQYKLVVWSSRLGDTVAYSNRLTDVTLLDADSFTNTSSVAYNVTRSSIVMTNDTTTVPATLKADYAPVTRYEHIRAGTNRLIQFTLKRNVASTGNAYFNAFKLVESDIPSAVSDVDGDGMPDAWEQSYFAGTSATNGGAYQDADGDGVLNLEEFIAGSSPVSMSSGPMMEHPLLTNSLVTFDVMTVTGRYYIIDYRSNVSASTWQYHTSFIGNGTAMVVTNTNLDPKRFYRFRVRMVTP